MLRTCLVAGVIVWLGTACVGLLHADPVTPKEATPLFNGNDFANFYTYLKGFGKNNDAKKVFTVHDGMIHVTGEVDGGLTTEKEYQNYRLVVEYKWGDKTWPPRQGRAMDSGIFLHCTGPDGSAAGSWPAAFEYQVWQGAVGDFIVIPGREKLTLTVRGAKRGPLFCYNPDAPAQTFRPAEGTISMIGWYGRDPAWKNVKGNRGKEDVEKPHGEWNTIEAICSGDTITNMLNGKIVNQGTNASHTKGKILLQSEGAEIFFRKVELHPLEKGVASGEEKRRERDPERPTQRLHF